MGTTRILVAASLRYRNRAEITVLMYGFRAGTKAVRYTTSSPGRFSLALGTRLSGIV